MGRFIHRDFFTSADLADLPAAARLMFAGMIVHADDAGVIREQPELFARVFCFGLDVRPHRVRVWCDALVSRGCVAREILEGVSCFRITNFARFQRLKTRQGKRREGECATSAPIPPPTASPGKKKITEDGPRPGETFSEMGRRHVIEEEEYREAVRRELQAKERAEREAPLDDVPTREEEAFMAAQVCESLRKMNRNGRRGDA